MSDTLWRTKVVLRLHGTAIIYYSPCSSEEIDRYILAGKPFHMQTQGGHYVVVNPGLVPAMEVHGR